MFGNIWPCKGAKNCRPEISSLKLQGYELRPKFHPKIHMYTVNVHDAKKAKIDLQVSAAHKTHKINHTVNKDLIKITVGNKDTTRQYFVGIAKQNGRPEAPLNSLNISNHMVFPAFNPKTLNYFVIASPEVTVKDFEQFVEAKAQSEQAKISFKCDEENGVLMIGVVDRKEKAKTLYRIRIIGDEGINYQQPMSFYNEDKISDDQNTTTSIAVPQTEPEKILPSHRNFSEHQNVSVNDSTKQFKCPHDSCLLELRNEQSLWNHQIQKHAVALCQLCGGCGFSMEDFKQHNSMLQGCVRHTTNDTQPTKLTQISEAYKVGDEFKVQLILMKINCLLSTSNAEIRDKREVKQKIKKIIEKENITLKKFEEIAQNLDVDDPVVKEFLSLTTTKPQTTFQFENIMPAKTEPQFSQIQRDLQQLQNKLKAHTYLLPTTPTASTTPTAQHNNTPQTELATKIHELENLNMRIEEDIKNLKVTRAEYNTPLGENTIIQENIGDLSMVTRSKCNTPVGGNNTMQSASVLSVLPVENVPQAGDGSSVCVVENFNVALEESMRALEKLRVDLMRVKECQVDKK